RMIVVRKRVPVVTGSSPGVSSALEGSVVPVPAAVRNGSSGGRLITSSSGVMRTSAGRTGVQASIGARSVGALRLPASDNTGEDPEQHHERAHGDETAKEQRGVDDAGGEPVEGVPDEGS